MKKLIILLIGTIALLINAFGQNVNIPDANFKAYLVMVTTINTNADTEIQVSEATSFSGEISVFGFQILDLTGIEAFTSLTLLRCPTNQLTSLDVSQNTALTYLECGNNQLTSLDVSQNTALVELDCSLNQLTSLDVSQNTALIYLECHNNQLTSLDVSQNTALDYLSCHNNQLTSLDVSQNITLTTFSCANNQITSLDVSQNTDLTQIQCQNNLLTSLDVSQSNHLSWMYCFSNQLTCLNLKNMINPSLGSFIQATDNPNLNCIEVDDVSSSTVNWTVAAGNIDTQMSFSTNCGNLCSLGITELNTNSSKKLSKIIDLTGREIQYKKNTLMIYIYEDGTSERVIEFE